MKRLVSRQPKQLLILLTYGFLVAVLGCCSSSSSVSADRLGPKILSNPYKAPWSTLPPTPQLPRTSRKGYFPRPDHAKIWYSFYGPPLPRTLSRGELPVIFLHGGFANSDYFGFQIAELKVQGYTVLAIDSRGHGRSYDGDGPITYDKMTEDVVAIMDHFAIQKAHIVGWSDGGIIGLDIAMNYSSRLDRLFSFGGSFNPDNINSTINNSTVFNEYLNRAEAEYQKLSPTPGQWATFSAKMNTMWATLPQWDETSFANIPTLYEEGGGHAPFVWVVDGEQEEAVNRTTPYQLRDWIPASGLLLLPSVSHFAMLQDPVTFTWAIRRFLEFR